MAALMNQWANEAAVVLAYWNTLRRIERGVALVLSRHITGIEALEKGNAAMGICWNHKHLFICCMEVTWNYFISADRRKKKNPVQMGLSCKKKINSRNKGFKKKQNNPGQPEPLFSSTRASLTSQGLDWGWFWGQISWQGNFVGGRHAAPLIVPEPASFFLFIKKC